jgi:uncharacterized membrane protein
MRCRSSRGEGAGSERLFGRGAIRASLDANLGCAMPSSSRVLVLDLLRLVAAVQMVEGHTLDAVLSTDFRQGAVHRAWLELRGLTSVAFLLAAGMAFALSTLRDLDRHRRDRDAVMARFRRAGGLVLLGYALRLPLPALFGLDAEPWLQAMRHALAADILQCIGVSLALVQSLVLVLPNARLVELCCGLLGASVLAASSRVVSIDARGPWLPLLDYVTPTGGSLFPLFPWAAHMLLGVAFGRVLLEGPRRALRLSFAAGLACLLCRGLAGVGFALASNQLGRVGWVLLGMVALSLLEPLARAWPRWLWKLSGQTLIIYACHVVLVYGQGLGLAAVVGRTLAPLPALALACAMIALSFGSALGYQRATAGLARRTTTG